VPVVNRTRNLAGFHAPSAQDTPTQYWFFGESIARCWVAVINLRRRKVDNPALIDGQHRRMGTGIGGLGSWHGNLPDVSAKLWWHPLDDPATTCWVS